MTNPNPFLPKGSLLEQQSLRRSRLKIGVSCVLAVSVVGLVGMLIQGCKREKPVDDLAMPPVVDTNSSAMDTNPPPVVDTNPPVVLPPIATNPPVPIPPPVVEVPAPTGSDYTVIKGDSLAKIAKKNGVSLKALEAANPGVIPTKLKVGQKLTLPAGGKTSADATASPAVAGGDAGTTSYTVKSGDTLTKIAKAHGVKVKALQAANNLSTTKIKVGQKLTIPAKADAAVPAAPPMVDTTPAPPMPPAPAMPAPVVPAPAK
jgi:LysM repeat protein